MNWFTELKRRGVVQVGVAYVVTAWLLVQVADIVLPVFDTPDWVMRLLVLLLAAGFPVTLVISWIFDLTRHGLVRTPEDAGPRPVSGQRQLVNFAIIGVLAAAVLLFSLDKYLWDSTLLPDAGSEAITLAVLPFENMSADAGNQAFTVGIHDDLLTQLSKINAFRTLSRTSVLRFASTEQAIPDIARQLGARMIVEGGVQRSADWVRINAQLIDGHTDNHVWAETYDRRLTAENVFAIQSDIARAIARELKARLSPEEEMRLDERPTDNLVAYDAYSNGLVLLDDLSEQGLDEAAQAFQAATTLDPEFAFAWAGLCRAELRRYRLHSEAERFEAAETACERALSLDDSQVEVHVALGTLYRTFGQYARAEVSLQRAHYAKAEQVLERALAIDSLTVEGMVELARVWARQNRLEEARQKLLEAEQLAPSDWMVQNALFSFYYVYSDRDDRFERAARHATKAASLRPDLPASWNNVGTAYFMLNQYDEAADAWQESLRLKPTRTAFTNTGLALYNVGRFSEAAEMQREATRLAPQDHRAWGRLADAQRFIEGSEDEAADTYAQAAELAARRLQVNGRDWRTRGLMAVYLVHSGSPEAARAAADRAVRDSDRRSEALFYAALVELELGEIDVALNLLEETVQRDDDYRSLISTDPDFQKLGGLPRFRAVLDGS